MYRFRLKLLFPLVFLSTFIACKQNSEKTDDTVITINYDTLDLTNDFYDNSETVNLQVELIELKGEIENPGFVNFSNLPLRSVIVKETILGNDGVKFIGAYKYSGYSLYDVLNKIKIDKKNSKEFNPITDLYVQIENDKGEKINVSWGEIYYPKHLQEIIIASTVTRIIPSKTKNLWPLYKKSKLIIKSDLITERNIINPVKITVKSYPKSFETIKGLKPLYSPKIDIFEESQLLKTIFDNPKELQIETYSTVFYGRGMGLHNTKAFTGIKLKELLLKYFSFKKENIQKGIFLVVAKDGYRGVFSFSEIMNRNDQSEVLLICRPKTKNSGIFRIFPASDFFSDRAIKGITAIYFSVNEE